MKTHGDVLLHKSPYHKKVFNLPEAISIYSILLQIICNLSLKIHVKASSIL